MAKEEGGQRLEPAGQASVDGILEPSKQFATAKKKAEEQRTSSKEVKGSSGVREEWG